MAKAQAQGRRDHRRARGRGAQGDGGRRGVHGDARAAARASAGRRGPPPSFDPQPAAAADARGASSRRSTTRKDSFGEMFDDRAGIIDPGPGADMNKPPPELEDPAEREQWAASEREARDEARAPYLAPTPPAVELTRFATTGRTQFEEVDRAAAPAPTPRACSASTACPTASSSTATARTRSASSGRSRMRPARRPTAQAHMAAFDRAGHWVARRFGEPEVFDEDVAGALVRRAPTCSPRTASASRASFTSARPTPRTGKSWHAHIDGILVFSRVPLGRAHVALKAEAPLAVGPPPFHAEVLDWEAVAAWVAPSRYGRAAHALAAPAPPEQLGGADDRLPRGRRRPQRGLLRRADHARGHGVRPP